MRIRWRILACLCLGGLLVWFLADAGAVTSYKSQYYTMYSLKKEIFETRILDILRQELEKEE